MTENVSAMINSEDSEKNTSDSSGVSSESASIAEKAQEKEKKDSVTLGVGDEGSIGNWRIKLLSVAEKTIENLQPAKGKFIAIQLEMKNVGKNPLEFSSLNNMSLCVKNMVQDLVVNVGNLQLKNTVDPGTAIVYQVVYDSQESEIYTFKFQTAESSGSLDWTFSASDLSNQ